MRISSLDDAEDMEARKQRERENITGDVFSNEKDDRGFKKKPQGKRRQGNWFERTF